MGSRAVAPFHPLCGVEPAGEGTGRSGGSAPPDLSCCRDSEDAGGVQAGGMAEPRGVAGRWRKGSLRQWRGAHLISCVFQHTSPLRWLPVGRQWKLLLLSLRTGAEQAVSSLAAAGPCCTGAGRPWAGVSSQPGRGARLSSAARLAGRETSPWKAAAWKVLGAKR